jgi:hypothetical protein
MVAAVVAIMVAVIPAVFIAEVIAKRRRLARWKRGRGIVGNDEFFASLGPVSLKRDAAVRVQLEVARATRMPADLISASDTIRELETVGACTVRFWTIPLIFWVSRIRRMSRLSLPSVIS